MSFSSPGEAREQRIDRRIITDILADFHPTASGVRDRAIELLLRMDAAAVIPVLAEILSDQDPNLRCDAAEALLRIDARGTVHLVLPLLRDPDPVVRWNTCGLLHDFGDERATEPLIAVLLEDPDSGTRMTAAYALGEVGDARAVPALQHAIAFDEGVDKLGYYVRDAAEEAIEEILSRR